MEIALLFFLMGDECVRLAFVNLPFSENTAAFPSNITVRYLVFCDQVFAQKLNWAAGCLRHKTWHSCGHAMTPTVPSDLTCVRGK
jgi:hypothetical protein